jgi:hydroxysqualene dehydroxylase
VVRPTRRPDVIVIGAGVAGLRAAVAAAARGAAVVVLEAKAVLGGRATAFTDPATGERVDNGQHVLLGCYDETLAFLRQIGTDQRVLMQSGLDVEFVDRQGVRSRLTCPSLPAPFNLLGGLFDWSALGWRDRFAALALSRPIGIAQKAARGARPRGPVAASPSETVDEWLIANGQTTRLREMLWEPLALAALNQSTREAAAPPFVTVLARAFGGAARNAALALPLCPLDELYAEPARRYVEARGGEVQIGAAARVHVSSGRVSHVEARGERWSAGAVVCAVPWYGLPELFAGDVAPLEALIASAACTRASPIVSVNLWLDRRLLSGGFLGLPGRTFQWVFDKGQVFSGTSHLTLVSSGADHVLARGNDELITLALRELRDALPDARSAKTLRATVFREKKATFSLAPGQPARPGTRTNVAGLYLAGDWIDTGLPATIESAAISGRRAAEAIS